MIIAETTAFRSEGKLFETREQAVDYNKFLRYKEAIENTVKGINEPTLQFMITLVGTDAKRKNVIKMIESLNKVDEDFKKKEDDAQLSIQM